MSSPEKSSTRIWVELDMLLDSRLATLYRISPELLSVCLENNYHTRPMDDWATLTNDRITNAAFWKAYSERDNHTLKEALPTKLTHWMGRLCRDLSQRSMQDPLVNDIVVEISTFPYTLTPNEKKVLCASVGHYVGEGAAVTTTQRQIKDLTPALLKQEYAGVMLYSFDDWFTLHSDALNTVLCPTVSMFAPALFVKRVPTTEELEDALEGCTTDNPFRLMEIALVERLHLQYMDVDYVSAIQ